eukprot:7408881-Heterocapsa_arctica.AAC.1
MDSFRMLRRAMASEMVLASCWSVFQSSFMMSPTERPGFLFTGPRVAQMPVSLVDTGQSLFFGCAATQLLIATASGRGS